MIKGIQKLSAKKLHQIGADLREKDKHDEAVIHLSLAIVYYQKSKNYKGVIDALKDRTLVWKHFFLLTKDNIFAILAKKDAESMLEIAKNKKLKNKLSTSYFRLGEIAMIVDDFSSASKHYQQSLDHYVGPESERGDFIYHLGEATYRKGDKKKGKKTMLEGLKIIQNNRKEVDSFLINVWESGGHMRLAYCLRKDEPKEAKMHLEKARETVESDDRLVIRKRQIKKLTEELKL